MGFLGGVFIFIALLMIPTAVIGLISPAKLAKKGATPASRTKILGSCLACFLVCIILGGAIVPNKRSQQNQGMPTAAPAASPVKTRAIAAETENHLMQAEALVTFPNSSIACSSKDNLREVVAHVVKREKTKADAYFSARGRCVMLDRQQQFKILSVEYNAPDLPEMGIMEIVGKDSKSSEGAWVFTVGASSVSSKG